MRVTALSTVLLVLILALSCPRGAPGQAEVPPASRPVTLRLSSFRIEGAQKVSPQEIKKELSIKLPSFWPPWGELPVFRSADLEYDVERLKAFYRRHGFFHTVITPKISVGPDGKVAVTLAIQEGPWVQVTDVEVQVAGPTVLADLQNQWPLQPGDRFTEKGYDGLKNLYLNYLPNHGYPRVKVSGKVFLDEEKNTARVEIKVDPGPLFYFGSPKIKQVEQLETPPEAILEKLTFKPGQIFNLSELFNSQRKLYATDLFKSVVLTPEEVPPHEDTIPIDIALEEKKKRSLKLGLGYGDEEKIRARVGLRFRNLGGGGRLLDLDARYSALGYKVEELFSNPVIFGTHFDLINQSGVRRRNLPGFTDKAYYTQTRFERDIPWNCRFYTGYGLEFSRPFDIPTATLIRLQGTEPEKLYRASYLLLGVRQDTVDSHIDPHKGGLLTFANEFAPTFLGSGLQFVQTLVDARRYHSIGDTGFVLAGRVKFGLIQPMQSTAQIPIFRRFFSGGATSVRGYKLDYLGPRNAAGDPIGGNAVVEASIEGRFPLPIYEKIGGVIFMDAGNVFLTARNIDPGQLKYSPGIGLRYLSPIGAVGIDVAFPVNRIDYQSDRPYQIHFTVGYGF